MFTRKLIPIMAALILCSCTSVTLAQSTTKEDDIVARAKAAVEKAEAEAKAEEAEQERKIKAAAARRAAEVRQLAAANRAAAQQARSPRQPIAPNAMRYHPRYGYMVGSYRVPSKYASSYRPNPYAYSGYGGYGAGYAAGQNYGRSYGYSAPYRTRAGTAVLGPVVYPSYGPNSGRSTSVRVYRQPAQSTTPGSHYFGNAHASQYIPN